MNEIVKYKYTDVLICKVIVPVLYIQSKKIPVMAILNGYLLLDCTCTCMCSKIMVKQVIGSHSITIAPCIDIRHAIFNTTNMSLLFPYINNTSSTHTCTIGSAHRFLLQQQIQYIHVHVTTLYI